MAAKKRPPNTIITTPSGIEIAFWDQVGVDGERQQRRYRIPGPEGEKFPSISTIAGIYDKPGLMPAAVRLQEEGVIALARAGVNLKALTPAELRGMLIKRGLHYDAVWQEARDRGDLAHDAMLSIALGNAPKPLSDYPAEWRPWITAGMRWFADADPPEIIAAEYLVASLEHRFAGRPDLFCRLRDERLARVEFKTVTEWKQKKNGKGEPTGQLLPPYDENLIQLAGQEIASVESGYDPSDVRIVVRLGPDGDYDVTESHATEECFLAALTAYNEKRYLTTGRPKEPAQRELVAA